MCSTSGLLAFPVSPSGRLSQAAGLPRPAASEVVPAQPASSAQAARGAAPLQEEGRGQQEGNIKESSKEAAKPKGGEKGEQGSRPALLPESR